MTLVKGHRSVDFMFPDVVDFGTSTGAMTQGRQHAAIFQIPKAGTIDHVLWGTGSVTTGVTLAEGQLEIRMEGVTAGLPDGTLIAAGANVFRTLLNTDDNLFFDETLVTPVAVTRGQWVSLVQKVPAVSSANFQIIRSSATQKIYGPYSAIATPAWSKAGAGPLCAVRFNTGEWIVLNSVWVGTESDMTYSDTSNPDERGIKFTMPWDCSIRAFWQEPSTGAAGTYDMILYDLSNNIIAGPVTVAPNNSSGANGSDLTSQVMLPSDVNLVHGTTYRLIKEATNTTDVSIRQMVPLASPVSLMGQYDSIYTHRNNGGSWTDVTDRFLKMGVIINGFHEAASPPIGIGLAG